MNNTLKRILMLCVIMMMVFACAEVSSFDSYAEQEIARTYNPDGPGFTSISGLNTAIELFDPDKTGVQNLNIYMTADWGNERLVIPAGKKVTLHMNGHMFNRGLAQNNDWQQNGENIIVRQGAILTINGGSRDSSHSVRVYDSRDADRKAESVKTINGGVIAGGCSANGGGGIHIESGVTLTLNDVTIAGCRAECPWYDIEGTRSGYGGGIWIKGENVTLKMNGSAITGCHAQEDGGGIYAGNYNNVSLELNDSHVDYNYSRSDGGGINPDGEQITIKGEGESSVSHNETNGLGGGIYLWNDEATVSGLTIEGNKAKKGGGIYTQEETIILKELDVLENEASEKGGGIYVENDNTTIADCTVKENKRHGVYVRGESGDNVDEGFRINGKTVITDNENGNLTIYDGASHASFNPARGADIHLNYEVKPSESDEWNWKISPGTAADCRKYLTSDDNDYLITYSYFESVEKGRRICFTHKDHKTDVTGDDLAKPVVEEMKSFEAAKPQVVGYVDAGGDKNPQGEYSLIRGILHREKTSSGTADNDSVFYYSDGLFYGDPYVYNDHLATASWNLAFGGTYLRMGGGKLWSYKYKHTGARQFFADIGCPDQNIYINDNNLKKPGTDTIGVIIGSKELSNADGEKTGDILIPVSVRGGGYESEWAGNVLLGSGTERDGEAQGFSEAADQVMSAIEYYIARYELEDELEEGRVKFWVSGFSRAGATANITSKRLVEKYADGSEGRNNQVFAYPCEAAKGGTDRAEKLNNKEKYFCIHNLINAADIVPLVGPDEMGFKRYGVDHYIPGTINNASGREAYIETVFENTKDVKRSGSAGISYATTYHDNERLNSKPNVKGDTSDIYTDYVARRPLMIGNLASIDSEILFNDYFRPRGLKIGSFRYGEVGDYEGTFEEDFIIDFLSFMQQESITSRKAWAEDVTSINNTEYGTIQQAARDTMALLFNMSEESTAGTMDRVASLSKLVSFSNAFSMLSLYDDVLGDWHTLDGEDKESYIKQLWDYVQDTGALEFLPEGEAAKLEKNWPVLAEMIFNYTDGDWEAEPGTDRYVFPSGRPWVKYNDGSDGNYLMYSFTMAGYVGQILRNHDPELNMAWARTYDDYYTAEDDLKEHVYAFRGENDESGWGDFMEKSKDYGGLLGKSYTVAAPSAMVSSGEEETGYADLKAEDKNKNRLAGDQRIILDVKGVSGEAIYYDLADITEGEDESRAKIIEDDQIYRGGIDLSCGTSVRKAYKITAYAASYGVLSDPVTYYITLFNDQHTVIVKSSDSEEAVSSNMYREGRTVTVSASADESTYFKGWSVKLLDENNEVLGDVTEKLLLSGSGEEPSDQRKNPSVSFVMPAAGKDTYAEGREYPEGYSLEFTAQKGIRIKNVIASLQTPVSGEVLSKDALVSFDTSADTEAISYPLVWTYQYTVEDKTVTVPVSGYACDAIAYTATFSIEKDETRGIVFAPSVSGSVTGAKSVSVVRNANGDATVSISFDPTEESGHPAPQPESVAVLTVMPRDLNRPADSPYDPDTPRPEYEVIKGDTVTITAPDVEDEVFLYWDIKNAETGIEFVEGSAPSDRAISIKIPSDSEGGISLDACYVPVVKSIAAEVEKPVGGQSLADKGRLVVTITNSYEIHQDYYDLIWTPAPAESGGDRKAEYLTAYTATVKIKPDSDGMIKARPVDPETGEVSGEWGKTNGTFIYSEQLDTTINGENAVPDKAAGSMSYTFETTKYNVISITPVETISGVDYGATAVQIKRLLPATTKAVLDDGREIDAEISWGEPAKKAGADALDSAVWTADGTVVLPDTVENREDSDGKIRDLSVSIRIEVNEAPAASSPRASEPSGTYPASKPVKPVTLSTATSGGSIIYTTDGSDPVSSVTAKTYNGEDIYVTRDEAEDEIDDRGEKTGNKVFVIRAVTSKWGMRTSTESLYKYVFTNKISVPEGEKDLVYNGDQQIGVRADRYYTLQTEEPQSSDFIIDDEGNASAKKAGTYKVRASLKEGFVWDNESASADDEIIEFRIFESEDMLAVSEVMELIEALPSPVTLNDRKQVEDARRAYDRLTERQKSYVSEKTRNKLEKAEKEIADIEAADSLSAAKADALAVLGTVDLSKYIEPERSAVAAAIAAARTAIEGAKDVSGVNAALKAAQDTIAQQGVYDAKLPKVKIKKPAKARKALKAKWKKLSKKNRKKVKGIEIFVASDKKFTAGTVLRTAGKSRTSKRIGMLKAKKTYYVRVRSYAVRDGVKYVGKWSKTKKVRTR